jgi:hypothetical protein
LKLDLRNIPRLLQPDDQFAGRENGWIVLSLILQCRQIHCFYHASITAVIGLLQI